MQSNIAELLHQYFELGVAEGREGRNHDTEAGDAQRVLSEIEAEIAALSTDAEPVCCGKPVHEGSPEAYTLECCGNFVKPAPAVAVKALDADDVINQLAALPCETQGVEDLEVGCCRTCRARSIRSALSAQVQDVAGWQDISTLEPKDGMIVMGWGEYRERDGFSPAFMRWYDSVGGWSVSAIPFYPTHWMPLPAAPAKQEGGE